MNCPKAPRFIRFASPISHPTACALSVVLVALAARDSFAQGFANREPINVFKTAPIPGANPSSSALSTGLPSAPVVLTEQQVQALKGFHAKEPISNRYAPEVEGYFKGPFGKKMFKFYNSQSSIVDEPKKGVFQNCEQAVKWTTPETMAVYCPQTWDGKTRLGVYVSLSPSNAPLGPRPGDFGVMDGLNLIFVSPTGTGNDQADMRRAALALDVLATIRKQYPVDESRIFVGGLSGGGALSAFMGINYPEFRGIVCQCRNFYLGTPGCSPYVEPSNIPGIARHKQAYVFMSGPGDFNQKVIQESMPAWKGYRIESTYIENDVPGHTAASPKKLGEALSWALAHSQPPHLH